MLLWSMFRYLVDMCVCICKSRHTKIYTVKILTVELLALFGLLLILRVSIETAADSASYDGMIFRWFKADFPIKFPAFSMKKGH